MDSLEVSEKPTVDVVIPRPLKTSFTYRVPADLYQEIQMGSLIEVSFKSKNIEAYVIAVHSSEAEKNYKLKDVIRLIHPEPLFHEKDLKFFQWIADYYQLSLGEVLSCAFPRTVVLKKPKQNLAEDMAQPKHTSVPLTEEQVHAIKAIQQAIEDKKYKSFLLFGITGSGKTEVYLEAALHALLQNKNSLILVPEIALTPQLRARFEMHFGNLVAVLHSNLTSKKRREFWWQIHNGQRKIVVGARSALFAPLKNIGLIVVDEEHEPSYKQEDRLRYHARDLALLRAHQHEAVVILGSATPSVETFYSAKMGRHELLTLTKRPHNQPLPEVTVVDLKKYSLGQTGSALSEPMKAGLIATISRNEQAILFVNRKGFSSFLLCEDCGHVAKCLNCSVSMTYYKSDTSLRCHYCGLELAAFHACLKCRSYKLRYMGMGTERIEEEISTFLPGITVARLDAHTADTNKKLEDILSSFREGKTQILIGTQMVAKGHDFPNVTFIGIILADLNLHFPDFRSGERTFQLLSQVSGRAGRQNKPGKVVLQTFLPDHPVIKTAAKQDYLAFYEFEINERNHFQYPPFSRLAQLEFRNLSENRARDHAYETQKLLDQLKTQVEFFYLGPAAASITKIANQYRWKILLKAEKFSALNSVLKTLRREGVRFIDVDPISTL